MREREDFSFFKKNGTGEPKKSIDISICKVV